MTVIAGPTTEHSTICRFCNVGCPLTVTIAAGKVVKASGNRRSPAYYGFCCSRGQALPEQLYDPGRLLHSLRRDGEGRHGRIASGDAMREISDKVAAIIAEHGPRSVALYIGTYSACYPLYPELAVAWAVAAGTSMIFTPMTIDQPGKDIANALAGTWEAGPQGFNDADTWLIVGGNPLVSIGVSMPAQNPAWRLTEAVAAGLKLIVIDPRRTQTAARAAVHLQPRPGHDAAILAAMIHVIMAEGLYDAQFLTDHAEGLDGLRSAVARWTPEAASVRAGIPAQQILTAARTFAGAKRGLAVGATGANMSGRSSLTEYLLSLLNILCGRFVREGESVDNPGVLLSRATPRAQPVAPRTARGLGETFLARGLTQSASGMPTAALAEEILGGRIKALISMGGNPAVAWPDQKLSVRALSALDLLVQFDVRMTPTAQLAHYVLAPKISVEVPTASWSYEKIEAYGSIYAMAEPFGMYAPRLLDPPPGADLIEEWELMFEMAQRQGLALTCFRPQSTSATHRAARDPVAIDMSRKPTSEELLNLFTYGSRISLDEVKAHADGALFPERIVALAADPGCTARFQLADPSMMAELGEVADETKSDDAGFPLRLVCRRAGHLNNSGGLGLPSLARKGGHTNPAFMAPDDMAALGLVADDEIRLTSRHGEIGAIVQPDPTLRGGVVSMSHAFGMLPEQPEDVRGRGTNTSLLTSVADDYDLFTGMPRMSAVPIRVRRCD